MKKVDKKELKAKAKRQKALNILADSVTSYYGPRCDRQQAGCVVCHAWKQYDMMEFLLDD